MAILQLVPNQLDESKKVFAHEEDSLSKILGGFAVEIEHIGSTALPQSITKPVLDILVIAKTPEDQKRIALLLVESGYHQGELDREQTKLFFSKPVNPEISNAFIQRIHLHLVYVTTPNRNDLRSIAIRDYLLSHLDEIEAYNAEKQRLATVGKGELSFYLEQKEVYIDELFEKVMNN